MKKIHLHIGLGVLLALLVSVMALSENAYAESEYWRHRTSLFEVLPIDSCDIVFLGNSLTDGGEFHELLKRSDVKNRGIQSDIISGVKKRLNQITRWHPRKIFLLIGINDISHGHSVDKLAANYADLVKDIRSQSPQTKLYIQSIMPINNTFNRYKALKGKENVIVALNNRLKEIAEENGACYIDLWPALVDGNSGKLRKDFTVDGLHLNGEGYKAWMSQIMPYLD